MTLNFKQSELNKALLACRAQIGYLIIISFLINILNLALPIYTMQVYDRVLSSNSTHTLIMLTLIVILAISLLAIIQAGRSLLISKMGLWLEKKLSSIILNQASIQSSLTKNHLYAQTIRDLQILKNATNGRALITILDIPWAIIFIIALFILHSALGLTTIIATAVMIAFIFVADKLLNPATAKFKNLTNNNTASIEYLIKTPDLINTMGIQKNIVTNWANINNQSSALEKDLFKKRVIMGETIKYFRLLLQVTIIGLSAYLVLNAEISSGAIIAASVLFGRALAPFEHIISFWKELVTYKKTYSHLNITLTQQKTTCTSHSISTHSPQTITATNLHFSFPGTKKHILHSINFSLEPREIMLITGPIASGKSTLAKLLLGMWPPTFGTIKINNIDIGRWNKNDLTTNIGYLPQQLTLFNGTIAQNIARMTKNSQDAAIIAITQKLGIHEMILKLPFGYNTPIGSNGIFITEGQKQLISLARTYYATPSLVILDSPELHLDHNNQKNLKEALKNSDNNPTTIIISNNLYLAEVADKILVLQEKDAPVFGLAKEMLPTLKKTC